MQYKIKTYNKSIAIASNKRKNFNQQKEFVMFNYPPITHIEIRDGEAKIVGHNE